MNKKVIILAVVVIIILFLASVGFYWWWQGKDLRELNKNLPPGIRVEKEGGQEVVINSKDDYKIKIPEEWKGLDNIDYTGQNLGIGGNSGAWVTVIVHSEKEDLHIWIKRRFSNPKKFSLVNPKMIGEEKINDYIVIKAKDFGGVMGEIFFYYLKTDSKIYEFVSPSEKNIKDIILNGNF